MNLDDIDVPNTTVSEPKVKRKKQVSVCPHPFCGKKGHKTAKSKHCLTNPNRLKKEGLEAAAEAAFAAIQESEDAADNGTSTFDPDDSNDAANDLAEYESQPFEEFEEDLFYTSGTWSEDDDGNVALKSGVI